MTSTPPSPPRPANAAASSTQQPSTQPPAMKPSAPPVSILSSKAARAYSLIHPVLVLVLFAIRFPSLVSDPVDGLLNDLPLLAVLQVAYVMVCLPPAGSVISSSSSSSSSTASASATGVTTPATKSIAGSDSDANSTVGEGLDGEKNLKRTGSSGPGPGSGLVLRAGRVRIRRKHLHHQKGDRGGISGKLIPALLSLTLTFLLATPVLAVLLVLFGAPLTTHNAHTILCAAHMAMLSATPLIYVYGVDGSIWKEIWGIARPADAVWGGALGTALGAWFGAVPIPLDWDRPWQAFPITIVTGAYIGYAVGSLLCRTSWLYGKKIQFEPDESEEDKKVN